MRTINEGSEEIPDSSPTDYDDARELLEGFPSLEAFWKHTAAALDDEFPTNDLPEMKIIVSTSA